MGTRIQCNLFLLLGCLVVGNGAVASKPQSADAASGITRFRFSESFHQEKKTRHEEHINSSMTETQTFSDGQVSIDFEVSLKDTETSAFAPSTPFRLKVGAFEFHSELGKDPDYHTGKQNAVLRLMSTNASGQTQSVLATCRLHWEHGKLLGKFEGKIPNVHTVAANDFVDGATGNIDAVTRFHLEVGAYAVEGNFPIKGQVHRKSTGNDDEENGNVSPATLRRMILGNNGNLQREDVTIRLQGEWKPAE